MMKGFSGAAKILPVLFIIAGYFCFDYSRITVSVLVETRQSTKSNNHASQKKKVTSPTKSKVDTEHSHPPAKRIHVDRDHTSKTAKTKTKDAHTSTNRTKVKSAAPRMNSPRPAIKPKGKPKPKPKPKPTTTMKNSTAAKKDEKIKIPKICWLMSFPNSGTSYTSKLIRTITNSSTATNYGASTRDKYGCSRPVSDEYAETGPFWQSNTYAQLGGQNGEYMLTKTHCGGYCNGCGPSQYYETPTSFLEACATGKISTRCRIDRKTGKEIKVDYSQRRFDVVEYDPSIVEGAVHVIRNPFDNIVSRFHLKASELSRDGRVNYERSREGFRKWCKVIDGSFTEEENTIDAFTSRKALLKKIPCHADFIRYLLWHHYAERVQSYLKLPTLILHYEDYYSDFNSTVRDMMDFLRIKKMRNEPEVFEVGKTYRDYFTSSEKKAVAELARNISTSETWSRLERYF